MNSNSKNSKYLKSYFNLFVLPVILFILTRFFYGFYFETNDDFVISMLLNGTLQPHGGAFENFYIHRFMTSAYVFLYSNVPSIPWYGLVLSFFNLISVICVFCLVRLTFSGFAGSWHEAIVFFFVYIIFMFENTALINFYKTAILLGGSSVLLMLNLLVRGDYYKKLFFYILLFLLFSFAFFTRPPAAVVALILIVPSALFLIYRLKKIRQSADPAFVFAVFILALLYSFAATETDEQLKREKFNTLWVNATDFQSARTSSISNPEDSIKKDAISYFFVGDKNSISEEFMNKVSSTELFTSQKLSLLRIKRAFLTVLGLIFRDYPGLTLLNLVILFYISIALIKQKRSMFFLFLGVQILFFLFMMVIDIFMKLPNRLFSPLYAVFTISGLIQLQYTKFEIGKRQAFKFLIPILLFSAGLSVFSVKDKVLLVKIKNEQNNEILKYTNNKFSNSIIFLSQPACTLLDCLDPLKADYVSDNKLIPIAGWNTIMPSFGAELYEMTGSRHLKDLFGYIENRNDSRFILISNERFVDFLSSYFRIIYDQDIQFTRSPEFTTTMENRDLYFYTVSK